MNVARQIAETLVGLGIRRAYGLPGEDHMAVLAEFADAGLEYCTAYNESSAVIMAATDAQLTGLPGVAILSLAPGVSNGVNGLLNTYLEQVPLLLISGQHPDTQFPLVVRQGFDIAQLVTPATKWRARIAPGMDTARVLGKAVDEAMSGRPGPVYLELADGVATAESAVTAEQTAAVVARLRERWLPDPAYRDQRRPSAALVRRLADRLAAAERPALVVCGRRRRVSPRTVAAFAEAFRTPVFVSSRQKGTLDGGHPFLAGTFLNGNVERTLLGRADLVVLVDPDPFDFYNRPWCFDAPAVALTEDTFAEWLNPVSERFPTDPETTLADLVEVAGAAGQAASASAWTPAEVTGYRDGLRSSLLGPSGTGMSVAQAVAAALEAWPADGYLVADAGFSKPLVAMLSEPALPDRFLASNTLSTMGYSIPAAVAAGRAGAQPVLSFLGDGSLLMRATELAVSPGTGDRTVWVAIMDRSLTQIGVKQERRRLATVGVELPAISCAKLGAALGIDGVDVDNPADLGAAVAKGLAGGGPLLVGAMVDPVPSREIFELLRG